MIEMYTMGVLVIFQAKLIILSIFFYKKLINGRDTDRECKAKSGTEDSFKSSLCSLR